MSTVRAWVWTLWVLLAVLVVTGLVATLGGFARAAPLQGPEVAAGATIELVRFTVVVDRVELVDVDDYGSEADPTLQVWLAATNTSDASIDGLPEGMVAVVADGVTLPAGYPQRVDGRDTALDPDLPRQTRYVVDWTAHDPPTRLDVVVYDEKPSDGFLDDSGTPVLDPTHPVAVVAAPLLDLRKRR